MQIFFTFLNNKEKYANIVNFFPSSTLKVKQKYTNLDFQMHALDTYHNTIKRTFLNEIS